MSNPFVWPYYNSNSYYYPQPSSPHRTHHYSRSWNAPGSPYSPYSSPVLPPTTLPPPGPPPPPAQADYLHPGFNPHARRHSFDYSYLHANQPGHSAWPQWYPPSNPEPAPAPYFAHTPHSWHFTPQQLPHPQLHPLINGDILPQHLHLDLSSHELAPYRQAGPGPSMRVTLMPHELEQPATTPELTRVRVICDAIPQWPVELSVTGISLTPRRPGRPPIPFITLGDVLYTVHHALHKKITHEDWGRLTPMQETDVSRAYTRRYKAFAQVERQQQREGVKRVDYLLRNYHFKGMTWMQPEHGVERMKLLTGPPPPS